VQALEKKVHPKTFSNLGFLDQAQDISDLKVQGCE